jgi:hypothetical protein
MRGTALRFSNAALGEPPTFLSGVGIIGEVTSADVMRAFGFDDCPFSGLELGRFGRGLR